LEQTDHVVRDESLRALHSSQGRCSRRSLTVVRPGLSRSCRARANEDDKNISKCWFYFM
jgi:hypothetical protein